MDQNPPKEPRPTANLRIKFRSDNLTQFIDRYAMDVSRGGIFIRTREPLAVGTSLKLDFQYQSGGAMLAGEGTVVWIREVDPNRSNVPPGMGVRFDKLSADSQAALEQILSEKARREGTAAPGAPRMAPTGMPPARPPAPPVPPPAAPKPYSEIPAGEVPAGATPAGGGGSQERARAVNQESDDELDGALDEEPTQIASGLPSFMTPGATPGTPDGPAGRPESEAPARLPGMAAGPPVAGSEATAEVTDPVAAREPGHSTPTSGGVPAVRAPAVDLEPGLAAVFASKPKAAGTDVEPTADNSAASPPSFPGTPSPAGKMSAGARVGAAGEVPEPPSAAHARGLRVPAPIILVSVLALASAGFFLVRFFRSEATETMAVEPRSPASPAAVGPQPAANVTPEAPPPGSLAAPALTGGTGTGPSGGGAPEKPVAPPAAGTTAAAPAVETAPSGDSAPRSGEVPTPPRPTPAAASPPPHATQDPGNAKSPPSPPVKRRPPRVAAPLAVAAGAPPAPGEADATLPTSVATPMPTIYQVKITSRPLGAEVSIDGTLVGKTPYAGTLPDLASPHVVAVKKAGFEPFEQTVTSSSAWAKSKVRGIPLIEQLKLSPKLRALTTGADGKSAGGGDDTAASSEKPVKPEKPDDNTLPPSEPPVPADGTQ